MPDDEGYSVAGELQVGGYAGGEMDVGEVLRPLAGFGRELEVLDEEWPSVPGVATGDWAAVRYVSPDQVESWFAVRGWQTK